MINEYENFKNILNDLKEKGIRPSLLLHSCCGPCSTYPLELLYPYFDITIYYYNPNITPLSEYNKRVDVQKSLIEKLGYDINIVVETCDHNVYKEAIGDTGILGEGSERCYRCYEFRIKKTSEYASLYGFDYYTTVMSVSPYKNSIWINELGKKYEQEAKFLYSNFKKEEGYKNSIALSKKYDLYRQDYCGCEFSIMEHEERVKNKK